MPEKEPENPRAYPDRPYVGVGVVIFRGDQVLLAQRVKSPQELSWSIPGGAQEINETVRDAGLREVREETGLGLDILGLIFMEVAMISWISSQVSSGTYPT